MRLKRIFGEEADRRREMKRRERADIRQQLYGYRPTLEERLAYGDLQPHTAEAEQSGLAIFNKRTPFIEHIGTVALDELGQSFVRSIRLDVPPGFTGRLIDAINIGEEELHKVAGYCGATVVPHLIGLYDARGRIGLRHYQPDLVPEGYALAAEVSTIKPMEAAPSDSAAAISKGIRAYAETQDNIHLTDLSSRQFMYGTIPQNDNPALYLADIDLRFR